MIQASDQHEVNKILIQKYHLGNSVSSLGILTLHDLMRNISGLILIEGGR